MTRRFRARRSIVLASTLKPGLATIIVRVPSHPPRTIKSRAVMVEHRGSVVQVAFLSGDIISLSARTAVGVIEAA